MQRFLLPIALAGIALSIVVVLKRRASAEEAGQRFAAVKQRVAPRLAKEMREKGLGLGSPIFIRIFKEERQLELWVKADAAGKYKLFRRYPICACSGSLGPKLAEGDKQAPEGFYHVSQPRMNPQSKFHLAFDLGYPNEFDRAHGRTGSHLMVHGDCVSVGCYAMTDAFIEEIYTLADAGLEGGQRFFRVHCFPFRMTRERLARAGRDRERWLAFWGNLKPGFDWFEKHRVPPDVGVRDKRYTFSTGS